MYTCKRFARYLHGGRTTKFVGMHILATQCQIVFRVVEKYTLSTAGIRVPFPPLLLGIIRLLIFPPIWRVYSTLYNGYYYYFFNLSFPDTN